MAYYSINQRRKDFEREVKELLIEQKKTKRWTPAEWVSAFMQEPTPVWVAFEPRKNYYLVFPFPKQGQGDWSKVSYEIKLFKHHSTLVKNGQPMFQVSFTNPDGIQPHWDQLESTE